jgi:DNA-binding XRE family transcriptional regulator
LDKVINAGIKALRAEYGLSQADMANIIGCSLTTYQFKETGKLVFSIDDAKIIKKHFKLETIEPVFFD